MKKIFFLITLITGMIFILTIAGCATHQLKAPCASFGKWCQKVPVNSWDDVN